MVDGYWRSGRQWFWRRYLKRKRGDHQARQDRCAWIVDATLGQACPKLLKEENHGKYCPKHQREWDRLTRKKD